MRKVTEKAAQAMRDGENMTSGNTTVTSGGNVMNLHGNTIAIYDRREGLLTIRDSGWTSATTKERLNGLLATFYTKQRIIQRDGVWWVQFNGGSMQKWQGHLTVEV